jgi:hypothetical protein
MRAEKRKVVERALSIAAACRPERAASARFEHLVAPCFVRVSVGAVERDLLLK